MGRALFSQKYTTIPAVREEPEPSVDPCENWSVWNQFDPDSDDFFKDAQPEYFVDGPIDSPIEDPEDEPPHVVILESVTDSSSSSSSSSSSASNDGSLSDNDSPMAIGADDPATLLAGAYTPVDWQQRFLEASSDPRRQGRPNRMAHRGPRRAATTRQYTNLGDINSPYTIIRATSVPVFIPPASYRNTSTSTTSTTPLVGSLTATTTATTTTSTTTQTQEPAPISSAPTPRSPISRRTVSITPINIPSEPSLPSPVTPDTPSTPSPQIIYPVANNFSPSPAPNVTPRVYTWGRVPAASSPTRDSPLTNPRARMSLSRIDTMALAQHQYIPVLDH